MYNAVVRLYQFFGCGGKLFSKWEHLSTKNLIGLLLWSASRCVFFIRPNTLLLCIFHFGYFSCTVQIHKLKFKSEYYLRINIGNPAIPLWFPKKWLFGFFILKKQLAYQNMFLAKSELSITTYLFLVFYRSTTLQSRSFLRNIDNFLCK